MLLENFCRGLTGVIVVAIVILNFRDRGLDIVENGKDLSEAFEKAVCLADGVVLGASVAMALMWALSRATNKKIELMKQVGEFAGAIAAYSLIVGSIMWFLNFGAWTPMRWIGYLVTTAVNVAWVVKGLDLQPKAGRESGKSKPTKKRRRRRPRPLDS